MPGRAGWHRDPKEYTAARRRLGQRRGRGADLPSVVTVIGSDIIMYASDYPHWDGAWPESTKPLRERRDISDDVPARIAGANARRFTVS